MRRHKFNPAISILVLLLCLPSVPAFAAAEGNFQRTLSVNGHVDLDVSSGSGSITVRTTLNTAEVAPMPSANVRSAAAVKPGDRRNMRKP